MELHSVKTKQLLNLLKLAFFMMRNGFLSKRKFISMEMSLIMKRGKILGKSLGSLLAIGHHHHSKNRHLSPASPIADGYEEYEFSCENSPNPVFFFHVNAKRVRSYFPCIGAAAADGEEQLQCSYGARSTPVNVSNGERRRQILLSPFSDRTSDCLMENEERNEVDDRAEEFIKRFYEQLRAQSPALLKMKEDEC